MTSAASSHTSTVLLPPGHWATVFEFLCARFPHVSAAAWRERLSSGRVCDAQGVTISEDTPYRTGLRVHYSREVAQEAVVPFTEQVLYADEYLVVADKPHYLPVTPTGGYLEQTLLRRLSKRLDNPQLSPVHRLDRLTAGLVMFAAVPAAREPLHQLFRERRIDKRYEALAPALPQLSFPYVHRSRLIPAPLFLKTMEVPGEPNSETRIEVLARHEAYWHYRLSPVTGRKHQLRVHMAALGAPIIGDDFYPELLNRVADDYSQPLRLIAKELQFVHPFTGAAMHFRSQFELPCLG